MAPLSKNRRQHFSIRHLRLRSPDSLRCRLLRPGILCRDSNHRNASRNVIWHHLHVGWYVCPRTLSSTPPLLPSPANTCNPFLPAQLSGLTLGLSVAGAIFLNLAQNQLTVLLPGMPKEQIQQLVSGTSGPLFRSLQPDVRDQALAIIVDSLRTT